MEKKTPAKVKTYGVRGLMEWWVELPTHQEKIKTVKVTRVKIKIHKKLRDIKMTKAERTGQPL